MSRRKAPEAMWTTLCQPFTSKMRKSSPSRLPESPPIEVSNLDSARKPRTPTSRSVAPTIRQYHCAVERSREPARLGATREAPPGEVDITIPFVRMVMWIRPDARWTPAVPLSGCPSPYGVNNAAVSASRSCAASTSTPANDEQRAKITPFVDSPGYPANPALARLGSLAHIANHETVGFEDREAPANPIVGATFELSPNSRSSRPSIVSTPSEPTMTSLPGVPLKLLALVTVAG